MAGNSTPVYNRNSKTARTVINTVSAKDIGQEQYYCTMNVDVKSAYLKESLTPSGLHRPYLEINGSVSSVFIENDDDRIFPCGSKSMTLSEPQEVRVMYTLSTSELQQLVDAGCYYSDFKMPENLVGNTMEIPGDITYTCVYDTPVGMVSINSPFNIQTSTAENHYDNFFSTFPVSKQRMEEARKLSSLQNNLQVDMLMDPVKRREMFIGMDDFSAPTPVYESVIKDYINDDNSIDIETPASYVSEFEPDPEKRSIKEFKGIIGKERADSEERAKLTDANKPKRDRMVRLIREQGEMTSSDSQGSARRRSDSTGSNQSSAKVSKMSYSDFKNAMMNISDLVNSSDQRSKKQDEEAKEFQAREDKLEAQKAAQTSSHESRFELLGKKQNRDEDEFQKREDKLEALRRAAKREYLSDPTKSDSETRSEKQKKEADEFQAREDKLEAQQRAMEGSSDKKRSSTVSALLNLIDKNKPTTPTDSPDYL